MITLYKIWTTASQMELGVNKFLTFLKWLAGTSNILELDGTTERSEAYADLLDQNTRLDAGYLALVFWRSVENLANSYMLPIATSQADWTIAQ